MYHIGDSDHIGGLIYILENIKVDKILLGVQAKESMQVRDLIKIADKKNIEIVKLKLGDTIAVEKNINIEVIFPNDNKLITSNELNNNSLVLKLKYNNFSMLFTGDIEEVAEKEILKLDKNLKSTVLKVAHHGSKTSSITEFLKQVSPKIAVIGVGKNNNFGHPSDDVLDRLNKLKIKTYRTDLNGEIRIKINKSGKIYIKTKF